MSQIPEGKMSIKYFGKNNYNSNSEVKNNKVINSYNIRRHFLLKKKKV